MSREILTGQEPEPEPEAPICPTCKEPITGAMFGPREECLRCFEAGLPPIPPEGVEETGESWSDVYVGGGDW
ncbi:hypothetical protein [Amycolatopsis taiwanensis]|uniref:hypothetical protein n=1 Tax=Amycolatopsis taiwanensis TaxID=342230 RepID=UPI0004833FBA|nr:hypothetical protein [Amycolatopsis taiwanensis]